jgi:hypothetical protein
MIPSQMPESLLLSRYNNELILIDGGIGDFLQNLPFMIANKKHPIRYVVATHFSGAKALFDAAGIRPETLLTFSNLEDQQKIRDHLRSLGPLYACPRSVFLDRPPFGVPDDLFRNGRMTLGLHIAGSAYSIGAQRSFGLVSKALPSKLIELLRSDEVNLLVFGSRDETRALNVAETDSLRFIDFPDVARSLSYVTKCFAVVASDSAIKTMSAMLRIPTIVWLGDYQDDPRDRMFIKPYVDAGVMAIYRYKDLEDRAEFNNGIKFTKNLLSKYNRATSPVPSV